MSKKITLLPGDGIGPEVMAEAVKVLDVLKSAFDFKCNYQEMPFGGAGYDASGQPLPAETLKACQQSDAVLLAAVGGYQYDELPRELRPERGLLGIRAEMDLFANLRPANLFAELADASSLKPELVSDLDILIVRELTGGIYFGQPRGIQKNEKGEREGFNTLRYSESEIERIGRVAFESAQKRGKRLCSVDKANVLECSELWREVISSLASEYPDVELSHMYVDNAAMQLIRAPKQFDVIVTSNLFGDILSDAASMLTGSIGMLPSASMNSQGQGLYEPVHGSAPDIAGQNKANPLAMILSVAMMLRYSFGEIDIADKIEAAVKSVLQQGIRCADIAGNLSAVGTKEMGDAVVASLKEIS